MRIREIDWILNFKCFFTKIKANYTVHWVQPFWSLKLRSIQVNQVSRYLVGLTSTFARCTFINQLVCSKNWILGTAETFRIKIVLQGGLPNRRRNITSAYFGNPFNTFSQIFDPCEIDWILNFKCFLTKIKANYVVHWVQPISTWNWGHCK